MQNFKLKLNNKKTKKNKKEISKGFTLIELLTAMGLIVVVGAVIGGILFSSLRGSNKAVVVARVKQSGTYAISQMTKMIRDAKSFDGIYNGSSFVTDCDPPVQSPSLNSQLRITSFDDGQTTFVCGPSTISSYNSAMSISLLDSSAIDLNTCQFICRQTSPSSPPTFDIEFSLSAKTTSSFTEQRASQDPIPFKTTVGIRNFIR